MSLVLEIQRCASILRPTFCMSTSCFLFAFLPFLFFACVPLPSVFAFRALLSFAQDLAAFEVFTPVALPLCVTTEL